VKRLSDTKNHKLVQQRTLASCNSGLIPFRYDTSKIIPVSLRISKRYPIVAKLNLGMCPRHQHQATKQTNVDRANKLYQLLQILSEIQVSLRSFSMSSILCFGSQLCSKLKIFDTRFPAQDDKLSIRYLDQSPRKRSDANRSLLFQVLDVT